MRQKKAYYLYVPFVLNFVTNNTKLVLRENSAQSIHG